MFTRLFRQSRAARVAIFTALMAVPLVFITNGCGGDNDGATTVIFVSPSPSPTGIPSPPLDEIPLPSPSPFVSPSASPFATPSPIPSPPSLGGI